MKGKLEFGAWGRKACALLGKYKYVLVVILAGVLLLLLPTFGGGGQRDAPAAASGGGEDPFDVTAMEKRLEQALSQVDGAGHVTVVLTVKSGPRQILAQDSKTGGAGEGAGGTVSTVVVSRGSGTEEAVAVQSVSPQYQGALVVCSGGGDPTVRLHMMEAVSALTGLGSDKISICKGK